MSDNEIMIAIAENLGWHAINHGGIALLGIPPNIRSNAAAYLIHVPNYTNDLNACRVFELTLNRSKYNKYISILSSICWRVASRRDDLPAQGNVISATAKQRCEAYLKIKNLWKD